MTPDTPQEIACLDRAGIWEGLVGFCEEMQKNEIFCCGNLKVELSLGLCNAARREAHRRVFSWPEGMGWLAVCEECPVRATEAQPPRPMAAAENEAEVGRSCADPVREVSSFSDPGGAPALKRPKTRKVAAVEVTLADHPLVSVDEVRVNGVPAPILEEKLNEGKVVIAAPRTHGPTNRKRKTEKRKQLLKTMSRAVARDLGLI